MKKSEIEEMARCLVADKLELGEDVHMDWAVQELITLQGSIEGDGLEFYDLCARDFCYRVVKKVVGRYDRIDNANTEQLNLKGFEHLQKGYTVERDSTTVLVAIENITDFELLDRAKEYDRLSLGCAAHAQEIRDYVSRRNNPGGLKSA